LQSYKLFLDWQNWLLIFFVEKFFYLPLFPMAPGGNAAAASGGWGVERVIIFLIIPYIISIFAL